jgi:hypothetical protein
MQVKARALLSPKVFQAIHHGTLGVVPLRTAKISFRYAIPRSAIFLVTQKVGHLAAFGGTKFFRRIHGPPNARVFAEIHDRQKQTCENSTAVSCHRNHLAVFDWAVRGRWGQ